MTTRIQTGFYQMQWNGKTFYIENLRGEIEGQLVWYITSSDVDVENECDVLWATKYEAIEMIKTYF